MPELDQSLISPTLINEGSSSPFPPERAHPSATTSEPLQNHQGDDGHSRVQIPDRDEFRSPVLPQQRVGISYRGNLFNIDDAPMIQDDTWSCVIVVLTFWFFASMTLILGFYGAVNLRIGPGCSFLVQPNPLFVQSVKVENLEGTSRGLMLYGLYNLPLLDVVITWSATTNATVLADSHMEWTYFLNEGSQLNISYNVNSNSSLFLIVAQGDEEIARWLEDPSYPNTTLSWNLIYGPYFSRAFVLNSLSRINSQTNRLFIGGGVLEKTIVTSSSYYIAMGNLNSESISVQLNLSVRAISYNTSEAYYQCRFSHGSCRSSILFPRGNFLVLTSPAPSYANTSLRELESFSDEWYVKLSYGPRWSTYLFGIVGMTVLMVVVFHLWTKFVCTRRQSEDQQFRQERSPLLPQKDEDLSSWGGSSFESISNEEAEPDNPSGPIQTDDNNTRRLCAICFDAPRDCFFLPCGHCVTCFDCGSRIADAGTCPICRRSMKKVRKIFTV